MSARDKLNGVHLTGIAVVAAFLGLATNSSAVALITAIVLIGLGLKEGRLRPTNGARGPPRSRQRRRWR